MPRIECNPECRCCGKTIDTNNEETVKVEDGLIHIECVETFNELTLDVTDWEDWEELEC